MKNSVPQMSRNQTYSRFPRADNFVIKLCLSFCIIHVVKAMSLSFPDSSLEDLARADTVSRLCPKGQWYHNETETCWPINKQGPCPPSLIFYAQDRNYGDCDCLKVEGYYNPVWVFDVESNQCFESYRQAYCKKGEWLIFDNDGQPNCVLNKCEEMQNSDNPNPVVLYEDMCVRVSESAEEGNCSHPLKILISLQSGKPICSSNTTSFGISTTSNFKCRPGTRRDRLGKCRPLNTKVTFRPSD